MRGLFTGIMPFSMAKKIAWTMKRSMGSGNVSTGTLQLCLLCSTMYWQLLKQNFPNPSTACSIPLEWEHTASSSSGNGYKVWRIWTSMGGTRQNLDSAILEKLKQPIFRKKQKACNPPSKSDIALKAVLFSARIYCGWHENSTEISFKDLEACQQHRAGSILRDDKNQ